MNSKQAQMERPSGEELTTFASDIADTAQARRVLAAALMDSETRSRIVTLRATARLPVVEGNVLNDPAEAIRLERISDALLGTAWSVAREKTAELQPAIAPEEAASILQRAASAIHALSANVSRVLLTGRQLLTLPCLAPATAAAAPDLQLRRQTITTGEGVRIEFQQLPGAPARLRVLVDSAALDQATVAEGRPAPETYDVAYLTLEEESGRSGGVQNRHVLVVSLNSEGRGYADLTVAGSGGQVTDGTTILPSPRSPLSLLSATLARNGESFTSGR